MFPFSPMLAQSGPLPELGNWAFEVKWDGFRALVSTAEGLGIRSRRGRDLTEIVPELDELPGGLVLDGELVAFDDDGLPSFAWACDRLVHGDPSVPLTFVVFDLLQEDRESLLHLPYRERRARVEALELRGSCWQTSERFEDGATLFRTVCDRGLEGVVAKPAGSSYRPGYRGWLTVENPRYRRAATRELATLGS